jgi:acyl-coenzyme A thioesterase PaaI-like protein
VSDPDPTPTGPSHASLTAASGSGEPDVRRAADALRRINAWLVAGGRDDHAGHAASLAGELERLATNLPGEVGRTRYDGMERALARHPVIGGANPVAPVVAASIDGTTAVLEVTYDAVFEGPPGCVHGGHIAAAFDLVLGFAAAAAGAPGVTGTLTVRYLRPTPLHEPLRYEAEASGVDGKHVTAVGRLYAFDDVVTAEADGTFVAQPGFATGRFLAG